MSSELSFGGMVCCAMGFFGFFGCTERAPDTLSRMKEYPENPLVLADRTGFVCASCAAFYEGKLTNPS
ncbi:hypothetical protein [Vibrio quintilis]|uniref:hypothetical protein n=1 Tax=Vibrio quintilis TaxID=1117707 RepID=UPI00116142BE|nr:hypothetical protein [Vibrio quintilis]